MEASTSDRLDLADFAQEALRSVVDVKTLVLRYFGERETRRTRSSRVGGRGRRQGGGSREQDEEGGRPTKTAGGMGIACGRTQGGVVEVCAASSRSVSSGEQAETKLKQNSTADETVALRFCPRFPRERLYTSPYRRLPSADQFSSRQGGRTETDWRCKEKTASNTAPPFLTR